MRRLLCVLALCLATGCSWHTPVQDNVFRPIIKVVPRPTVDIPPSIVDGKSADLDFMIDLSFKLAKHIEYLESLIGLYNEQARAHNAELRRRLGLDVVE